ncbi:MAG: FeoB-associated Cys-rich membrane protein [Firmicutes bacterium]|nr:FeoB-associated Cys-rich membrane protein [Bacillota bacterium]
MSNLIVIAILIFLIVCVMHYQYTKRKRKQNGCASGCSHCPFHDNCHSNKKH